MEDFDKSIEIELLLQENKKLKNKINCYEEAIEYYANPLSKWDKGKIARQSIINSTSKKDYSFSRIKNIVFNTTDFFVNEVYDE